MRRILLAALAAILLLPAAASAQTRTVVTGTVTGTDGIVWNGGSITATIVSGGGASFSLTPCTGGAGCPIAPSTSPTGITATGFSMSPWANASILPAGTTYTFTATINPGVPPPIGTGPQTCTMTGVTLSGASQTVNLTGCPALTNVSGSSGSVTAVTATAPVTSSGGTAPNIACATCTVGGVTGVTASLPIVVSGGVTPNLSCPTCAVTTVIPPIAYVIYVSPACGSLANCATVFDDTQMNATGGRWTSGSNAISCATCTFLPTDCVGGAGCTGSGTGKEITGLTGPALNTNPCGSGYTYPVTPTLPETTIATYVDSHDITTAANATGTATTSTPGCLFWGHIDDTGLSAADTLLQSAASPTCPTVIFPLGIMWAEASHFTTIPSSCANGFGGWNGAAGGGPRFTGQGQLNTMLFMAPNFAVAGCPATGCWNGIQGAQWDNLAIFGGNNTAAGGSSALILFGIAKDDVFSYLALAGFGNENSHVVGMEDPSSATQGWANADHLQVDGFGSTCIWIWRNLDIANSSVADCVLPAPETWGSELTVGENGVGAATIRSSNTQYAGHPQDPTNNSWVYVQTGGRFLSDGDTANPNGATATETGIYNNGGTVFISHDRLPASPASNIHPFGQGSGSLTLSGTMINTTSALAFLTGGSFIDGCGNSGLSGFFNFAGGTVYGSCSVTGTTLVATNVTPSTGWGTSGAAGNGVSAPSGSSQLMQFTITAAGVPGLNPTAAVVFPVPFLAAPICSSSIDGSIGSLTSGSLTTSAITATGLTLTASGTPTAAQSYQIQVGCKNP